MSASVWFEELSAGLLTELYNTIKVKDSDNTLVALPRTSFIVRKPEEDFKIETYPCVSIYHLNYKHDPQRYYPHPVVMSVDKEHNTAQMQDSAVPYNITVQIDFWTRYQTDMDTMTRTWLMRHFRQFNLSVTDDGGTERTCNCLINGDVEKSDLVSGNERLYHTIIRYTVWVEIDDEVGYTEPVVGTINIDTSHED